MSIVFADSSYLIALEIQSDQRHQEAQQHWRALDIRSTTLVVTSFILDEVVTYLNSRRLHAKAVQIGNVLLQSNHVEFVQVETTLLTEGWRYFQQHSDKEYSLTDCISFVVMRDRNIGTALTFDRHFVQAGFLVEPYPPGFG